MEEEKEMEFKMPGAPQKAKPVEVSESDDSDEVKEEITKVEKPKETEPVEEVKEDESENAEGESKESVAPADGKPKPKISTHIFALRTTANREDQVMDFITSHIQRKKLPVFSVIRPHGMRGYIFLEAESKQAAEESARSIPYARGILAKEVGYNEIEHMLEQVKREVNIKKNDIVEIISGPFKREQAKISRFDKVKEEVVVELLEAAVPIPITLKLDAVKVIRREGEEAED